MIQNHLHTIKDRNTMICSHTHAQSQSQSYPPTNGKQLPIEIP